MPSEVWACGMWMTPYVQKILPSVGDIRVPHYIEVAHQATYPHREVSTDTVIDFLPRMDRKYFRVRICGLLVVVKHQGVYGLGLRV